MSYEDLLVETKDTVTWITLNREESGNKFRHQTVHELVEALEQFRRDPEARVCILTGAGTKYFCIGGEHDAFELRDYSSVLPIIDVYELIDVISKPIIAAVNGFAVGGGNVLHTVCDLTIAAEHAIFRQVGPLIGSFDAGFGTWYLEETIGRKRAKEMWYLNRKYTAQEALAMGLVNEVVESHGFRERVAEVAAELSQRAPGAIAGLKAAFSARHTGVIGQARLAHDQLLMHYLTTSEAAEMQQSFNEHRSPDREKFLR